MAQRTDVKESAAPEASGTSRSGPEDCTGSAGPSNQSETGASTFKTIQTLKEWYMIKSTINKAQNFYESLKRKSRIFNWSCSLAEKTVDVLRDRSSKVLSVMYPAVHVGDLAASYMEEFQEKLPIVRQSPYQVFLGVRSALSNLAAPLVQRIEFPVTKGKRWTRNVAESVVGIYRKLVLFVDKWLGVEEYIYSLKSKERKDRQVEQPSVTSPPRFYHQCNRSTRAPCLRWLRPGRPNCSSSARLSVCCPDCLEALLDQSPFSSSASSKYTLPVRRVGLRSSLSSSVSPTASGAVEIVQQQQQK